MATRPVPPRKYEMMIVVAPTVTEEGLPAVAERVSAYVTDQGGEIESFTHENPWGRRRLAYPIQNFQDAFYVLYYFHSSPRSIDEIERELRLDEQVIRHLIMRYDPMTERTPREERQRAESAETAEVVEEVVVVEETAATPEAEVTEVAEVTASEEASESTEDEEAEVEAVTEAVEAEEEEQAEEAEAEEEAEEDA